MGGPYNGVVQYKSVLQDWLGLKAAIRSKSLSLGVRALALQSFMHTFSVLIEGTRSATASAPVTMNNKHGHSKADRITHVDVRVSGISGETVCTVEYREAFHLCPDSV